MFATQHPPVFGESPSFVLWKEEAELRTEWKFQAVTSQPPYTRDKGTYLGSTSRTCTGREVWSLVIAGPL